MKLMETAQGRAARACYENEWSRRHSIPPPSLYPERREDPLWQEGEEISTLCWQRAEADAQAREAAVLAAEVTKPTWTVVPGWIVCPNNHAISPDTLYCPHDGLGPVPPAIRWEALQQAGDLAARATAAWLRSVNVG